MSRLKGAVVLALALTGCGGPLEEETMDVQNQRQMLTTPSEPIRVDRQEPVLMLPEQTIIRKFAKPDQQDHLFYKVNMSDGHCTGGH